MSEAKRPSNHELAFGNKTFHLLPPRPELQRLIDDQKEVRGIQIGLSETALSHLQSPHIKHWETVTQLEHFWTELLAGALRDQDVVDIGAGAHPREYQEFVGQFSPSSYIGIDMFAEPGQPPIRMIDGFGEIIEEGTDPGTNLSSVVVRGDALEAASRLPDGQFSVMMNGIDNLIISSDTEYGRALEAEINRITSVGGVVFGLTAFGGILHSLSKKEQFETLELPYLDDKTRIYFLAKRRSA